MTTLRRLGSVILKPFSKVASTYDAVARRFPLSTGVGTTVLKTTAADVFAQKVVERREDIDWRRNGLFTAFGFAYLGCFQFWLYNYAFVSICKPITRAVGHYGSAVVKTFIDQGIHHPLFYFPAFYACKGAVEGRPLSSSFQVYKEDLWENCKALWMVWVPAQMVNFAVVPLHLRIPFVAGVSFAWTVIISTMRGSLEPADPAEVPVMVQHHMHDHDHEHEHGALHGAPGLVPGVAAAASAAAGGHVPTLVAGAAPVGLALAAAAAEAAAVAPVTAAGTGAAA